MVPMEGTHMNRSTWETIVTAMQAWQEINFNATDDYDRRLEQRAYNEAIAWLISVEPKEIS
jgi:hypothetical protein